MSIVRALMLGTVAGMRSMLAPAAVSRFGPPATAATKDRGPRAFLQNRDVQLIVAALAAGELVADKLPFVPSRKSTPAFLARVFSGALSGAALSYDPEGLPIGLIFGAAGSVLGTFGGASLRSRLAELCGADFPAALLEDALAMTLIYLASEQPRPQGSAI